MPNLITKQPQLQQTVPSGTIEIFFMSPAVKICQLFTSMEGQSCKPTKNNWKKKGPWFKKSFDTSGQNLKCKLVKLLLYNNWWGLAVKKKNYIWHIYMSNEMHFFKVGPFYCVWKNFRVHCCVVMRKCLQTYIMIECVS